MLKQRVVLTHKMLVLAVTLGILLVMVGSRAAAASGQDDTKQASAGVKLLDPFSLRSVVVPVSTPSIVVAPVTAPGIVVVPVTASSVQVAGSASASRSVRPAVRIPSRPASRSAFRPIS